ncbi:MAG: CHAP domain-containing protein [Candidatus Dormibacteraceae bacterium]
MDRSSNRSNLKGPALLLVGLLLTVTMLSIMLTGAALWNACAPPGEASAQNGLPVCIPGSGAGFFQPTAEASAIPQEYLKLYLAAGAQFDVAWPLLAGIGKMECNHGQSLLPGCQAGTNFAGAAGPMQFLSGTWNAFHTAAPGSSSPSIYNPGDAIYTAAHYLVHLGAAGSANLDSPAIHQALFGYNHSNEYVDQVINYAKQYAASPTLSSSGIMGRVGQITRILSPLFSWVPAGGLPGTRFYQGFEEQCTYYAAYQWPGRNGEGVSWSSNAADWLNLARGQGYQTSPLPSVGAIAVWPAMRGYSPFGHVAIVTKVQPDSYTVSEQNFSGPGIIDQRTIPWPDSAAAGFIPVPA